MGLPGLRPGTGALGASASPGLSRRLRACGSLSQPHSVAGVGSLGLGLCAASLTALGWPPRPQRPRLELPEQDLRGLTPSRASWGACLATPLLFGAPILQ